jgi:hypothetical protein
VASSFERSLQEVDAKYGHTLTATWRECLEMHRENDLLRVTVRQMHAVLQSELENWAPIRAALQKRIKDVIGDQKGDTTVEAESLAELLDMNEKLAKVIDRYSTVVAKLNKEMRQTEFQSRFWFHINRVQRFAIGITAVLTRHFQSSDRLPDAVADIRALARTMTLEAESEEITDEVKA